MFDRICRAIAWALPRRIAYWCYLRVHSEATVRYHDKTPDEIDCFAAAESWQRQAR